MDREDDTSSSGERDDKRAERKRRREAERAETAPASSEPTQAVQAASGDTTPKAPKGGEVTAEAGRVGPAQFLREVRSELKKVAWPSRTEIVNYTIVVLIVTTFLTLLVFGMDYVIRNITVQIFS